MDPATLAMSAVSLLGPHLAKAGKAIVDKVGKEAYDKVNSKVEALYEIIKNKFKGDEYANQTLKRMEEKPEDKGRQTTMECVLKDILVEDLQFQKTVSELLTQVKKAGGENIIQIYGNGAAATHGGVAAGKGGYAAGRDMIIDRIPYHGDCGNKDP